MTDPYSALARMHEHDRAIGVDPLAFDLPRTPASPAESAWRPPPPPWADSYRGDEATT